MAPYLARPVYEALPFVYATLGLVGLAVSHWLQSGIGSAVCGAFGFVAILLGAVLWLHRRDFRRLRGLYAGLDSARD